MALNGLKMARPEFQVGDPVKFDWDGSYAYGNIVAIKGDMALVQTDRVSEPQYVPSADLEPGFKVGDSVRFDWDGSYAYGNVVSVQGSKADVQTDRTDSGGDGIARGVPLGDLEMWSGANKSPFGEEPVVAKQASGQEAQHRLEMQYSIEGEKSEELLWALEHGKEEGFTDDFIEEIKQELRKRGTDIPQWTQDDQKRLEFRFGIENETDEDIMWGLQHAEESGWHPIYMQELERQAQKRGLFRKLDKTADSGDFDGTEDYNNAVAMDEARMEKNYKKTVAVLTQFGFRHMKDQPGEECWYVENFGGSGYVWVLVKPDGTWRGGDYWFRESGQNAADLQESLENLNHGRTASSKKAGQWGTHSWDSDQVHDVLDTFREGSQGFKTPVPPDKVVDCIKLAEQGGDEIFLGVVAFLAIYGDSKASIPPEAMKKARDIASRLYNDQDYLQTWQNPDERSDALSEEMGHLGGRYGVKQGELMEKQAAGPFFLLVVEQPDAMPYTLYQFPNEKAAAEWVGNKVGYTLEQVTAELTEAGDEADWTDALEHFWITVDEREEGGGREFIPLTPEKPPAVQKKVDKFQNGQKVPRM